MDVINVPNEEKDFTVSEKLLSHMLHDNYDKWLELICNNSVSERLLRSLEKVPSVSHLKEIRHLGLICYELPDETLENIIELLVRFNWTANELVSALDESYNKIQRSNLLKALRNHIKPDSQE